MTALEVVKIVSCTGNCTGNSNMGVVAVHCTTTGDCNGACVKVCYSQNCSGTESWQCTDYGCITGCYGACQGTCDT